MNANAAAPTADRVRTDRTETPPAASTAARRKRQIARMTAVIQQWWAHIDDDDRLPYYSPEALTKGTGVGVQALASALTALGWRRAQTRIAGRAMVVWVAPGESSPVRPVGRPPAHGKPAPDLGQLDVGQREKPGASASTVPGLVDELSSLIDAAAEAEADTGTAASVALSPPSASEPPSSVRGAEVVPFEVARQRRAARKEVREALVDAALHAAGETLRVIQRTFAENGADFDDACKALPLLHKVLEHVERMDAAKRSGGDNRPVIQFEIVMRGDARRAASATPAIDITTIDAETT